MPQVEFHGLVSAHELISHSVSPVEQLHRWGTGCRATMLHTSLGIRVMFGLWACAGVVAWRFVRWSRSEVRGCVSIPRGDVSIHLIATFGARSG